MAKQPLIELTRGGSGRGLRVVESNPKKLRKGVLLTLEGVFGETETDTQNGRTYSNRLWKRQLEETDLKERLRNLDVLGEADHPDGLESSLTRISHVITDEWLDESNNLFYGRLDVLDTPSGRIVKTLTDYGWIPGISSRGAGEITSSRGRREIDPDTYEYITHDLVIDPACRKARLTQVAESRGNVPLKEALIRLAEQDKDKYEQAKSYDFYVNFFKEKFDINLEESETSDSAASETTAFLRRRIAELSSAVESLMSNASNSTNSVELESHNQLVDAYTEARKKLDKMELLLQKAEKAKSDVMEELNAIHTSSSAEAKSVKSRLSAKSAKLAEMRKLHLADKTKISTLTSQLTESESLHTGLLKATNEVKKQLRQAKLEIKKLKEISSKHRQSTASTRQKAEKANPKTRVESKHSEKKIEKKRPRRKPQRSVKASITPYSGKTQTTESKDFNAIVERVAGTVGKTANS